MKHAGAKCARDFTSHSEINRETSFADYDLCCLHDQLSNQEIQSILRLLANVHSPSVDSFHLLTVQLHEGLERAASNVTYLNTVSEACNKLRCPDEVEAPMMKILMLILFIWVESPFYNISYDFLILSSRVSRFALINPIIKFL